jgi:hypothetical protein
MYKSLTAARAISWEEAQEASRGLKGYLRR